MKWTRTTHAGIITLIKNIRRLNEMAPKEQPGDKFVDKRLTNGRFKFRLDPRIDPQTPGRKLRKSFREVRDRLFNSR